MRTPLLVLGAACALLAACLDNTAEVGTAGDASPSGSPDATSATEPPEQESEPEPEPEPPELEPYCVQVSPATIVFGGKLVGALSTIDVEVANCGAEALTVAPGLTGSELFSITGPLPDAPDAELSLQPGETELLQVRFEPQTVSELDAEGQPTLDEATLALLMVESGEVLEVPVSGFGVEIGCPTSVIKVLEGEEVGVGTKLHLVGSQSFAPVGSIASYQWSVVAPPGIASVFLPSASAPDPTYAVDSAGTYVFNLMVHGEDGVPACQPAEYVVQVLPELGIHVELLWHTPNDPDETDEGPDQGADLDLHFLHPFAETASGSWTTQDASPWFDHPYDCFWFNAKPDWASFDPSIDDDPVLLRDDTDGAGPELLAYPLPEEGLTYRIGVHYWNDHGFGESTATVRVYILAALAYEAELTLKPQEFWEVATIDWPSGEVKPVTGEDGGPAIVNWGPTSEP